MKYKPTLKHRLEYILLRLIIFFLRLIPSVLAVKIGGFIGRILWHLGIRRNVSIRNFELCFPGCDENERDQILKKSYDYFCRSVVEYAILPKIRSRISHIVRFNGEDELRALRSNGRGAILVTGHFGSWELFGAALADAGYEIDFLVGTQKNRLVDALMNRTRREMGIGIIHLGVAVRGVLKSLRAGKMVAMLSDQDAGDAGIITNFFGKPASTPAGAAVFAIKTKCPIVAGYIVRNDDGITHTGFVRKLTLPRLSGEHNEDISTLTQFFTHIIEEGVKHYPEQYFWAHRRFKSTIGY